MKSGPPARVLGKAATVLAAVFLLCSGVLGLGRGGAAFGFDLNVFWCAGRAWLHGLNAYDPAALTRSASVGPFANPPQIAPLCLFVALFPLHVAPWLGLGINVMCLLAIDRSCQQIFAETSRARPESASLTIPHNWWLTAVIVGNPFTSHVVFMGQTSLMALAAILGAWRCVAEKRYVAAGILACAASIKPQMTILVLLWFLLERRVLVLAVFAVATALASVVPALTTGPLQLLPTWFRATRSYAGHFTNAVNFQHRFGIDSLLDAAGLHGVSLAWFGLLLVAAIWFARGRFVAGEIVAMLLAIAVIFVYAHDYDLVALLPFAAAYAPLARRYKGALFAGAAFLLLMSVPQRFVSTLNSPLVNQFRVPVVLCALVLWLALRMRRWEAPTA